MLQNIRENSQGIIAKIIIGLIVLTFALFGIDSLVGGGGQVNVATVNGEDISLIELEQALNLERRRLMSMLGENADPTMFSDEMMRGRVLERLIQQKLLMQAADDAGIGISSTALDQTIVAMQQFQQDGQFSADLYQSILRSNGYTPNYFKQVMAEDLTVGQLNSGVAGSDFVTPKELESVAKIVGQQRSFRYFIIPKDKVTSLVDVTEEEVQQHYDDNISRYQTDELVKLEYIELRPQDFFKPIDEEALLEVYESEMASFDSSEERRASHILIEMNDERDEDEAKTLIQDIAQRLQNGEDFAALAETYSDDIGSASNAGDVGFTRGDTFPEAFEEALFGLELNQASLPVQTEAGFHIIVATEINLGEKPSFEQRKAVLTQRLQLAAAESDFVRTMEDLRDLAFNSEGLSSPAKELDLEVKQSDLISRATAAGALENPLVLSAAFSDDVLTDGNNSEVLELASDHFIVLNVVEHQLPRAKALASVREDIVNELSQAEATELSQQLAESAIEELNSGTAVEDFARDAGYEWQVHQNVTRNGAQIDGNLMSSVFSMPRVKDGDLFRDSVVLSNGDVAVVQLEEVEDGSWAQLSTPEQNGLRTQLVRGNSDRSMGAFLQALRAQADIRIL